ncbi:hypothetical protein JZ751_030023 [Albula glossodonta]|uniref:Uncharacterized protein n=1 Tax=Albula glossodonta TaxID=121402 RepID=A0A8T2NC95_9TELE|nr:hypothetical protein JZ751_030023 [Albula glossodonta]
MWPKLSMCDKRHALWEPVDKHDTSTAGYFHTFSQPRGAGQDPLTGPSEQRVIEFGAEQQGGTTWHARAQ